MRFLLWCGIYKVLAVCGQPKFMVPNERNENDTVFVCVCVRLPLGSVVFEVLGKMFYCKLFTYMNYYALC